MAFTIPFMRYKALMSDIDGTLVPYDYQAVPSQKVVDAVTKAAKILPVSLVTGRGYTSIRPILKRLNLTEGYAVVNNGAFVVENKTEEIIYERFIPIDDFKAIAT